MRADPFILELIDRFAVQGDSWDAQATSEFAFLYKALVSGSARPNAERLDHLLFGLLFGGQDRMKARMEIEALITAH